MSLDPNAPVVVVSADSHVGPRLREDMRRYCPKEYLDEYDAMVDGLGPMINGQEMLGHPNWSPGHYDATKRIEDMDNDGVAAEIIYHGSQNGEPLPFSGTGKFGIGTFDATLINACNQVRTRINFQTTDLSGFYVAPNPGDGDVGQERPPLGLIPAAPDQRRQAIEVEGRFAVAAADIDGAKHCIAQYLLRLLPGDGLI